MAPDAARGGIDARDVNRALRTRIWPALKAAGFDRRTDRAAWRETGGGINVVEIGSVGSAADSVGSTSFSFSAFVGAIPGYLTPAIQAAPVAAARRPHYWDCPFRRRLEKSLRQPWFEPFARPPSPDLTTSMRVHREGLERVIRRDRHDRPDIWFVRDDGSNLGEVMTDLGAVLGSTGLPLLERLNDPCAALTVLAVGGVDFNPDSPAGEELGRRVRSACSGQGTGGDDRIRTGE